MYLICKNLLKPKAIAAIVLLGLLISIATSNRYAYGVTENDLHNHSGQKIGLVCDANSWDFGRIKPSEAASLAHYFVLQNNSTEYIEILDYSSTCGCTSVELLKKSIAPEEYFDVLVNVDWSSRSGKQEESVFLKTNHPANPKISLTVEGVVVTQAVLSPSIIDFGLLKPGQLRKRVAKLAQGLDISPFKIIKVDKHSENIQISRINTTSKSNQVMHLEGDPGDFEIIFICPESAGNHDTAIEFHTDIEDQPILRLPIKAASHGMFNAVPNSLFFEPTNHGTKNLKELQVDYMGVGKQLNAEILSTQEEVNPFYIKDVKLTNHSEKTSAVITVGFRSDIANRLLYQSKVRIRAGKEVLHIPVVGILGTAK